MWFPSDQFEFLWMSLSLPNPCDSQQNICSIDIAFSICLNIFLSDTSWGHPYSDRGISCPPPEF